MWFIRLCSAILFVYYVDCNGVSFNHPDQMKHYYYNPTWLTYDEHNGYCKSIGGHVIQIESHAESEWIQRHVVTKASFMLGAKSLPANSSTTTWFDEKPITWLNWNVNQPQRGTDYCDQIFVFRPNDQVRGRRMKWYTQQKRSNGACDWKAHVLCEIPSGYRVLSERMNNRTELLVNQLSRLQQDQQRMDDIDEVRTEMENLRHELKELKGLFEGIQVEKSQTSSEITTLKTGLHQTKIAIAVHVEKLSELYEEREDLIKKLRHENGVTATLREEIKTLKDDLIFNQDRS